MGTRKKRADDVLSSLLVTDVAEDWVDICVKVCYVEISEYGRVEALQCCFQQLRSPAGNEANIDGWHKRGVLPVDRDRLMILHSTLSQVAVLHPHVGESKTPLRNSSSMLVRFQPSP